MLENTESLLPLVFDPLLKTAVPPVLTIGVEAVSLDELDRLLWTLGLQPVRRLCCHLRHIHPATYIGKGKIEEAKKQIEASEVKAVILDVDLAPNQLRNLEKEFNLPILDRTGVIIEIFSRHAQTKESKTQVALARMQYLLPRLTHFWTHFERQRGGSVGVRGMGEKQIEVDRRLVKKRITVLKERLREIECERKVQRAGRKEILKVALVGYTNAGKSTVLNGLTRSVIKTEDKLFATLDARIRTLDPHSHPPIVVIDTVGFINQLPPSLVASFRSTLEELYEADLLLHVVDASHDQAREQLKMIEKILEDLNLHEKPRMTLLNKMDQITHFAGRNQVKLIAPGAFSLSALCPEEIQKLRATILDYFYQKLEVWEILLPYSESKLEAQIYEYGLIEVKRHLEKGTFYRLKIEQEWGSKLNLKRFKIG